MNNFKETKPFFVWSTFLFFISFVFGIILSITNLELMQKLFLDFFQQIHELGEEIFKGSMLSGAFKLFLNNLRATITLILFGLFFPLTVFGIVVNAGAIGVLSVILFTEGLNPLKFILFGILPHGIFEIPALLIGGGLGLKIGWQLILPPGNEKRSYRLINNFRIALLNMPLIVLLLIIAAFIEIYITPVLIELII